MILERITDYEILERCGRGAAGEVYLARTLAGSLVALKVVEKNSAAERELAGLRNYSRLAPHPNLIRIFHIGESGDSLYYTMELADDCGKGRYRPETLASRLEERKRLDVTEMTALMRKLLAGLAALHRAGLAHRDIKPENILFVGGEPKLSDIGLVRSVSQSLSLGGTLGFIPPERLRAGTGSQHAVDDLYALGKVLYCCLTGLAPNDYPSLPPELLRDEYRKFNAIVIVACNRNPALRFHSAAAFAASLSAGISVRQRIRTTVWCLRYFLPAVVAAALVAVALGWLGVLMVRGLVAPAGRQKIITRGTPLRNYPPEAAKEVARLKAKSISRDPFSFTLGEIANRTTFGMTANDGTVAGKITSSGWMDPVYNFHSPQKLDYAPRRRELLFTSRDFAEERWKHILSDNFINSYGQLKIAGKGRLQLDMRLPDEYAITFEVNPAKLDGALFFGAVALDKRGNDLTYYRWGIRGEASQEAMLAMLEYQPQDERKIDFELKKDVPLKNGFHQVEMVQTAYFFRLFIDGRLVIHSPSLFMGGFFFIESRVKGGGVILKNFRLEAIPQANSCPPDQQYTLPVENAVQSGT